MNPTDYIGFTGVSILLVAFLLNLIGNITQKSFLYLFLNFLGAGIACLASVMLNYIPFIILEGCWTFVSAFGIYQYFILPKKK